MKSNLYILRVLSTHNIKCEERRIICQQIKKCIQPKRIRPLLSKLERYVIYVLLTTRVNYVVIMSVTTL